jgi:hypothetical protein
LKRRLVDAQLSIAGDEVMLSFHEKTIRLPGHVLPQMEFICGSGPFTGAELPGDLDESGRIVLISELLREGFLTLA